MTSEPQNIIDPKRIDIDGPYEREYWRKQFGVTEETLIIAVTNVGSLVKDVGPELTRLLRNR